MSDDEDDNNYNEEAVRMEQEVEAWKAKYKQLELKKRESELSVNKIKTEINSLRSVDKHWKDASKLVYLNIIDMQKMFFTQVEQIVSSLAAIGKTSDRIQLNASFLKNVKQVIGQLQAKIAMQEESILSLTSRIKLLTNELDDKTKKVERLSAGLEEEVERIVKPMREKLADCMVNVMKEKAARAQERRELADLWPEGHLMPTVLMKHRALSDEERQKRIEYSLQQNASLALSLEVRANVIESKMWAVKYDDYGRPFYEHSKTGETAWEPPEIMKYQPPPGRDEMGNVIVTEENDYNNWTLITDSKGKIFYQHNLTGQTSTAPPYAYKTLPRGRTREDQVSEAASLVLSFIKEKIGKHIAIKTKRKEVLENPLTPEQQRKKEKELSNMTAEELAAREPELSEEGEPLELSLYQYDIETVEMLSNLTNEEAKAAVDKDPEAFRDEQRAVLKGSGVRSFPEDLYEDISMVELDIAKVSMAELRGIVENLASKEEKLEVKLEKTRNNIRDFSVLLVEKIREKEAAAMKKLSDEKLARERERQEKRKQLIAERRRLREAQAKRRKEEKEALEQQKTEGTLGNIAADAAKLKGAKEEGKDKDAGGNTSGEDESVHSKGSDEDGIDEDGVLLPYGQDEDVDEYEEVDFNELLSDEEVEGIASKQVGGGTRVDIHTDDDVETIATSAFSDTMFHALPLGENQSDYSSMMPNVTNDLCNFALFCGYNNLQISDSPDSYNLSYSLLAEQRDKKKNKGAFNVIENEIKEDDEWLTCNFFLGCNKDDLDKVKAELSKDYEQSQGMLHVESTEQIASKTYSEPKGKEIKRSDNHSYLASNRELNVHSYIAQSAEQWKATQLMTYVVIQQLNKQKIRELYNIRNQMYNYFSPQEIQKIDGLNEKKHPEMNLEIQRCILHFTTKFSPFQDSSYIIQFFIGSKSFQSDEISPLMPHNIEFTVPSLSDMNINDIQLYDLLIEVLDKNNSNLEKIIVGRGSVSLDECVGRNFNQIMAYEAEIYDNDHRRIGRIELQLKAKLASSYVNIFRPEQGEQQLKSKLYDLQKLEELVPGESSTQHIAISHKTGILRNDSDDERVMSRKQVVPLTSRNLSVHHIGQQNNQEETTVRSRPKSGKSGTAISGATNWTMEIGELRGDGTGTFVHQYADDAHRDNVLRLSTPNYMEIQSDLDNQSYVQNAPQRSSSNTLPKSTVPLPNFNNAKIFLEKKLSLHTMSIQALARSIDERKHVLEDLIKQKQEVITKYQNDNKSNIKKYIGQADEIKANISIVLKSIHELRKPYPEPKEPEFDDLGPVPFVPNISLPSQLDSRGKKKKALSADELKTLLDNMEIGKCDGLENISIPDGTYPNQAQLLKLNKAREARNIALEAKRVQEIKHRERMREMYAIEFEKYEEQEKVRLNNLRRACKDSRRQHLKYYNLTVRIERYEEENRGFDDDRVSMSNLIILHQKATQNYKQMVLNFLLEFQRLEDFVTCNKKKLHKLLNARRHILEYPSTARTKVDFEIYAKQCSEYLYNIQLEIFSIKNSLYMEGKKILHLQSEERQYYQQELMRLNVSIEIVNQRFAFDSMTSLYRINTANYYGQLLKFQIEEADQDDEGIDTIEDKGECYKHDKEWQSPDVNKFLNMIKTIEKKVNTISKYNLSTATSQSMIIAHFMNVVNQSIFNHQDSYIAYSDYERAAMLYQIVANAMSHPSRVASFIQKQHQLTNEKTHLDTKIGMVLKSYQQNITVHEQETYHMNENAHVILSSSRSYIENYRTNTEKKTAELEQNIILLSKECQKIREELLAQQMVYTDKIKILWAFIHTLQQSLQQLTSKMEIMTEENEKTVIKSKLMADHMKLALFRERQHNANLYFILHSQRGIVKYLYQIINKIIKKNAVLSNQNKLEKSKLRQEIYNTVYMYIILSTNLDYLFEFFLSRLAVLSGSNIKINNQLAEYKIADILSVCCRIDNHQIKYYAAKALSNIGWNSFVEKRILVWDCLNFWKHMRKRIIDKLYTDAKEGNGKAHSTTSVQKATKEDKNAGINDDDLLDDDDDLNNLNIYQEGFTLYDQNSNVNSIIRLYNKNNPNNQILISTGNVSLRTLIKQRKQWALRITKRRESPNIRNQKLLNGVLMTLFELCIAENQELSFTIHDLTKILQQVQHQVDNRTIYRHDSHIERIVEIIETLHKNLMSHSPRSKKESTVSEADILALSPQVLPGVSNQQANYAINITRYAALAIAIASYEQSNHHEILSQPLCIYGIFLMCQVKDIEVQSHAAISIGNLCYRNELAQILFGELGLIGHLITMLTYNIADILEAATSALSNLTSYNDKNCRYFMENEGIAISVKILINPNTENLLDTDQSDEIQANIAELLTNISRYNSEATISYFTEEIIQSLILFCASNNIQCKRYIPLILGNISQNNMIRGHVGMLGGIEALFLALESDDTVVKCNILWSLSNMMYYPPNQERAGRYISELMPYILLSNLNMYTENVRNFALILLGNLLYYNTANRVRFLEIDLSLETILTYIKDAVTVFSNTNNSNNSTNNALGYINMTLVESSLRILLSLSYLDSIALYLGANDTNAIPVLIHYLTLPYLSHVAIRYTLEILCNLSLHHSNRLCICQNEGIEHIIPLHAHMDEEIRRLSVQIIAYLEDITPEEVLVRKKNEIPIERMVKLSTHEDVLVRALAAEQIGEYIYNQSANNKDNGNTISSGSPRKTSSQNLSNTATSTNNSMMVSTAQDQVASLGGVDSLLAILGNPREPVLSLLPALWSLRNVVNNNVEIQNHIYQRDGIAILCSIFTTIYNNNIYAEQVDKVIESILSCLLVCIHKNDRNSRRLVMIGLDRLLPISTTSNVQLFASKLRNSKKDSHSTLLPPINQGNGYTVTDPFILAAMQQEHIQSLLHQLFLLLGPYNYVVCQNCGKKQDLHGTSCLYCAHRLLVPLNETNPKYEHHHIFNSPKKAAAQKVLLSKSTSNLAPVSEPPMQAQGAYEHKPSSASAAQNSSLDGASLSQGSGATSKFSMARSLPSKKQMYSQDN